MTRYLVEPRDRIFVKKADDFCLLLTIWVEILVKI